MGYESEILRTAPTDGGDASAKLHAGITYAPDSQIAKPPGQPGGQYLPDLSISGPADEAKLPFDTPGLNPGPDSSQRLAYELSDKTSGSVGFLNDNILPMGLGGSQTQYQVSKTLDPDGKVASAHIDYRGAGADFKVNTEDGKHHINLYGVSAVDYKRQPDGGYEGTFVARGRTVTGVFRNDGTTVSLAQNLD